MTATPIPQRCLHRHLTYHFAVVHEHRPRARAALAALAALAPAPHAEDPR